jgi:hypothetical protein
MSPCSSVKLTSCCNVLFRPFPFQIWILCNDCGMTSNVQFHILAHKCPGCSSYNTRQTRGDQAACSRAWERERSRKQINHAAQRLVWSISCRPVAYREADDSLQNLVQKMQIVFIGSPRRRTRSCSRCPVHDPINACSCIYSATVRKKS